MPWERHPKPLSRLKLMLVPSGKRRRRVLTGAFRGLSLELDLRDQTQVYLGLHEREVYGFLGRALPQVRSAVDVGAAEGEYAIHFARAGARPVIAFEPDADLVAAIRRNAEANRIDRREIEIVQALAGAAPGDGKRTLDAVCAELPLPALIKIDVDGAESEVLAGAERLLASGRVLILLETHATELEESCESTLRAAGYVTRIIPNAGWRIVIPENRPIPHNRWLAAVPRGMDRIL